MNLTSLKTAIISSVKIKL